MHWLTGLTYLYCLATGLAFYSPYLFWLATVARRRTDLALLASDHRRRVPDGHAVDAQHLAWRHGNYRDRSSAGWIAWRTTPRIATNSLPLSERFNAGQKLFYWLMFYGALLLLLSGMFLWLPEYIPRQAAWVRGVMILVHEIAALATIGGFLIHVYMGVFLVPGSMTAITTGFVSRAWARTHHRLWYMRVTGGTPPQE